ncbi:MAG: FISUMP domain-containing protein, partial [Bacteroidota bacterium]
GPISGPNPVCQNTSNVNYSVNPITNAVTYVWTLVPAASGNISGPTETAIVNWLNYTGTATINVKGVNSCGSGPISNNLVVTVNPRPVVTYTSCNDSVTTTDAVPFKIKGGIPLGGVYTGAGVVPATGIFYPAVAGIGTHAILFTYNNMYSCSNSATKQIKVVSSQIFNCGELLTDVRDNLVYPSVLIGTQCWMAENLNHGNMISSAQMQRDNCFIEKYCYNNTASICSSSGALYQWDEIMRYETTQGIQGLCPPGWHIPTELDWHILFKYYISNGFAGSPLKFSGYSGYNALLSGVRFLNKQYDFDAFSTFLWSSTQRSYTKAWAHAMNSYNPSVSYYPGAKTDAFSVRCLKD